MDTAKMNKGSSKGFTLLELMLVIGIIGILAAMAVPQFLAYRDRAYNLQANSDAKNFYAAAVVDSGQSSADKIYNAGNLPSGYNGSAPVSGSFEYTSADGSITCDAAFKHSLGSKTYTLDNDGNISIS